jgi:hypothetical protein
MYVASRDSWRWERKEIRVSEGLGCGEVMLSRDGINGLGGGRAVVHLHS